MASRTEPRFVDAGYDLMILSEYLKVLKRNATDQISPGGGGELQDGEGRWAFVAGASRLVADSLDYETTLATRRGSLRSFRRALHTARNSAGARKPDRSGDSVVNALPEICTTLWT